MAIATAPVDFEAYDRPSKPTPLTARRSKRSRLAPSSEARRSTLCDRCRGRRRCGPWAAAPRVAAQGSRLDAAILVVRGRIRSVCRAPNGREISVEVFRHGGFDRRLRSCRTAAGQRLGGGRELDAGDDSAGRADDVPARGARGPDGLGGRVVRAPGAFQAARHGHCAFGRSGAGRLAAGRAGAAGRRGPAEGLLIRNRPTQQELANQIGACRETVSRTVSELVRQGLLTPRGRSLLVSKRLVEGSA